MSQARTEASERVIVVTGQASVSAEPDVALISLGVVSEAATAADALAANSDAMRKVIDAVKAGGVDAKDVRTSNFSIQPRYQHGTDNRPPKLTGYQVSSMVHVRLQAVARTGMLLDQIVTAGANQVHGIAFEVAKADELKNEARRLAVANAIAKARLMAEAAGVKLGRVLAIEEAGAAPSARPHMRMARADAMHAQPPIEPGSLALDAHVTVTLALE